MKKRYLYTVLWGVPGLLLAATGATILIAILAGVLWLYAFGDNPWPAFVGTILMALGIGTFLGLWTGLILYGYRIGKRLESQPGIPWKHILLSLGVTLAFVLYIVIQQFDMGNLGPQSDSLRCSEFCQRSGYPASAISPANSEQRTCSCYNDSGLEVINILVESIEAETPK